LAASNEEFQRFAYRTCHDLKEPLRAIGIYTELLTVHKREKIDIDCRTCTRYILDGVKRIQNQMRQLLEYATAGSFEVKCELIDFNVILESAITGLRARIIETGATVSHDTLPSLIANSDRIQSIFENLIGNALKYQSAYLPRIHISARLQNDEWIFSVRDNGIGFEMRYAGRVFGPFERLSADAKVQGSGLGLAIVKRIVELNGGRVWAESEVGTGSTFYFSLPRSLEKTSIGQVQAQGAQAPSGLRAS
jgi:two-component system, chemotaxis family, sensor kinase Cph1